MKKQLQFLAALAVVAILYLTALAPAGLACDHGHQGWGGDHGHGGSPWHGGSSWGHHCHHGEEAEEEEEGTVGPS